MKDMLSHVKNAFFHSSDGLVAAVKEEAAFRLVIVQGAAIFLLAFFVFPLSYGQRASLALSLALTLIVELLNSSIENIVDLITPDWHILAKKAKDMGSAAQFVASASLYVQILLIFLHGGA
jgi:diacylglycerol kinase (ATP)